MTFLVEYGCQHRQHRYHCHHSEVLEEDSRLAHRHYRTIFLVRRVKKQIAEMAKVAELLKYATIVVSSLPLLVMYPFFQKYFDKGIMVGSVKG